MANVTLTEGVKSLPTDSATGRLWGAVRRQQYTNQGFSAATTTPFSGNTPAGILVYDAKLSYASSASATPAAELDLSDLSGLTLIVANNGSGQTLSGITIKDYDLLPTSGLTVPGQSYTTATNVATGASVTLDSLSLANNTAIRLWMPITDGSLRQFYVEPTYAAAVTVGTGSLEVMAIPTFGEVALKGSLAPKPWQRRYILGPGADQSIAASATYSSAYFQVAGYAAFAYVVHVSGTTSTSGSLQWAGAGDGTDTSGWNTQVLWSDLSATFPTSTTLIPLEGPWGYFEITNNGTTAITLDHIDIFLQ